MHLHIGNDWEHLLEAERSEAYMIDLLTTVEAEYESKRIYPKREDLLNALAFTPYDDVKAVILGQDPYHGEGQANGLSFSVQKGVRLPPSLRNIYQELVSDIGCEAPQHGSLEAWAKQGVLLLNTVLTVEEGKPASHQGMGWEIFTNRIIGLLNDRGKPVVFILWGKHAQAKANLIDRDKHFIISSPHPSPFAARKGFFGSRPFSRTNEFLMANGVEPIDWSIPSTGLKAAST